MGRKINIGALVLTWLICIASQSFAVESALWSQFQEKLTGTEPILPDFSYAGYDYSESPLPDTSGLPVFDVTNYGAVVDDGNYDDVAIQATIDAAEAAGGGIVFFPPGRFMVSRDPGLEEHLTVNGSHILLKGSGSGVGGTEIFMDQMQPGYFIFEMRPLNMSESTITTVVSDASRESFEIEVANASNLSIGQRIILSATSVEYAQAYYAPLTIYSAWTRLLTTGFNIRELHIIQSIHGNTVRLREPLHLPIWADVVTINVRSYNMLTHVGIEDILFKGNWDSYPETFVHHKDTIHDDGWDCIRWDNLENSWIRNCEFSDFNISLYMDGCARITVENVLFSGKKGHTSCHTRRGYGVLFRDCQDTAGHHHGPGVGYWGCGTVFLRYQMAGNQAIDCHSGSPYATLHDGTTGGHFNGMGGPHESYPHHARDLVFWNFDVSGGASSFTFWQEQRNSNTFAMPIFAGLQGKAISMTEGTYLANESPGQMAEPASLFEAQLQFRLIRPSVPVNLFAIAGNSSVELDWDDNDEPNVTGYTIYRATSTGGPYTQIDSGVPASAYEDNTAADGIAYYYVVTAVNTSGYESGYSNEAAIILYKGDLTLDGEVNMDDVVELGMQWLSGYDLNTLVDVATDWLSNQDEI